MNKLLTMGQAAKMIGVVRTTLLRWEKRGRFKPRMRTPLGHRRYALEDIEKLLEGK
jgi:DNA-binding transcriptional MerR regulator